MSRSLKLRFAVALAALAAGATVAALAFAKSSGGTVKSAQNASLGESILVDNKGHSLYELNPETTHHLLCNAATCFGFWPPYKVSAKAKLTAGAGVKGKLSKLHRNGFYQVTLAGHPLYRFGGDKGTGQVTGNGIKSFGGTWHVVKTGAGNSHTTTATTTTTTSTSSTYSYPSGY